MSRTDDDLIRRTRRFVLATVALLAICLVGSVVWWRMHLSYEVNGRLRALQRDGLPTSGAELNRWYVTVPDQKNAALVLTQAFALMQTFPDQRSNEVFRFKPPPHGQPLSSTQKVLLSDYVALNAEALATAKVATQLPRSRFPVDFSPGFTTPLPHLAKLKGLAQSAGCKAILAVQSQETEEATRSLILMLNMAQSLENEPVSISQLVRVAILKMSVRALEYSLASGSWADTELSLLASRFTAAEKTNLMALAFMGERAMAIPYFRDGWANLKRLGQTEGEAEEASPSPSFGDLGTFFSRATGFFERDLKFYLRVMETNISLAGAPPPRRLTVTNVAENAISEAKRRHYLISIMLLSSLSRITVREAEGLAELRAARAALAVERFRTANDRLPKDLGELVPRFLPAVPLDPFDGAPLRYELLAKGYVVYSIGRDGHDDGGQEPPVKRPSTGLVKQDITFTVDR